MHVDLRLPARERPLPLPHVDITGNTHHDAAMRTTVAIDDDVLEKLRQAAAKHRKPLTKILNETLRRGLSGQISRPSRRDPYRVDTFDSAFRPGIDPLRLNQTLDDLDIRRATDPPAR